MQLQGAILFVRDLPRMIVFYTEVVGLEAIRATQADNWIEFDTGAARFSLHAIRAEIVAGLSPASSPPQPREQNPLRVDFGVRDVEAARARLQSHGVRLLERPWGAVDFVDPEGNVFGLRSIAP